MAWFNRDLRLPGQGPEYREHPSDVGSPSYFADTGRGWVPNRASTLNRSQRNIDYGDPGIPGRPSWRDFDNISQGYDRAGPMTGVQTGPSYHDRLTGKFDAVGPGAGVGIASLDEDEKMGLWGHTKQAFNLGDLPMPKMMQMAGDTVKDAMRGSRLHSSYKDAAVAAGGTKAEGSKAWERDKKMMVPSWDLRPGDPGYEGSDKHFYDKYIDLADMAQESDKKQFYLDQAETAWRNKQTSDRLAAATGFEDYAPGKYTGEGEGARYTGNVAGSLRDRIGDFVPGVDIMRGLREKYQGAGSPQDYETGEHWDIAPDREFAPGYDQELPAYSDEPFKLGLDEDITNDIDFRSGIYQEGGSPSEEAMLAPPGGYLDVRDTLPEKVATRVPSWRDVWGMPGLMKEEIMEGYPEQDLEYLLDPEEYYKKVYKQKYIPPFKR